MSLRLSDRVQCSDHSATARSVKLEIGQTGNGLDPVTPAKRYKFTTQRSVRKSRVISVRCDATSGHRQADRCCVHQDYVTLRSERLITRNVPYFQQALFSRFTTVLQHVGSRCMKAQAKGSEQQAARDLTSSLQETEGMTGGEGTSGLPVDHGWSWVIMAGHFMMTLVMGGYGRALALFLMEFVVMFQSSVTAATMSYAVMTAAFGVGNVLVTHVLLPRFDTRHVILTGAVTGSVVMVISSLAPSVILIVFLHVVIGFSHAMMHTSSATLMGPYFQDRRGLANAVSNTGYSISALLIPPLIQFLIASYGTRGALLLTAGIQMQGIVAGCLMRPVEFYTRPAKGRRLGRREANEAVHNGEQSERLKGQISGKARDVTHHHEDCERSEETPEEETLLPKNCEKARLDTSPERQSLGATVDYHQDQSLRIKISDNDAQNEPLKNNVNENTEHRNHLGGKGNDNEAESPSSALQNVREGAYVPFVDKDYEKDKATGHLLGNEDKELVSDAEHKGENTFKVEYMPSKCSNNLENGDFTKSTKDVEACESLRLCEDEGCAPNVSVHKVSFNDLSDEHSQTVKSAKRRTWRAVCESVMSKVVDVSLFRNWCFLLIMMYFPFGQTNAFLAIFLPALGVERGLTHAQAALLLTVMGAVDLVSRLLMGLLADTGLVRRTWIVAAALAVLSTTCMFIGFYTDFGKLVAFSVMFGLCGGTNQNMLVVVVVELLGLPHLRSTLGMALLMQCVCLSVSHPLMGALVDWTGTYAVVYYYVGGCLAIAVLILLTEPLARKLESRRIRRMEETRLSDQ